MGRDMSTAINRDMYFEDFQTGDYMTSPSRTITEADVVNFAGISGDYNPIHTDVEFAKKSMFGKPIAHGILGLSVATGLAARLGFIENTAQAFLGLDWKFKGPIFIGDTIRLRGEVTRTKALGRLGGGVIVLKVSLLNQRDEVVQEGEWTVLVKSRPNAEGGIAMAAR